ncbi:MAG: type II secretion system protein, partial [Lentisphaeria bacterium]
MLNEGLKHGRSPKTSRGFFTLMELLIVMGIIAVLASMLLPVLSRARETAMQSYCRNNLRQLCSAALLYRNDQRRLPFKVESSSSFKFERVLDDFSLIYPYLNELKVFACPGNPESNEDKLAISKTDYLYWPGAYLEDIDEVVSRNTGGPRRLRKRQRDRDRDRDRDREGNGNSEDDEEILVPCVSGPGNGNGNG